MFLRKNKKIIIIMLLILAVLLFTAYQGGYRYTLSSYGDLTDEQELLVDSYYGSKYHLWYIAFMGIYGIIMPFILAYLNSDIYAYSYYKKSDLNYVYRLGLNKYFISKLLKSIIASLAVIVVPLVAYWLILNIIPTTNEINIYYDGLDTIAPTIDIFDSTALALAYSNPSQYIFYTMLNFTITLFGFSCFAFAFANLLKNRILRFFLPPVVILVVDLVIGMIFDVSGSIFSNALNPTCLNSLTINLLFSFALIVVSIILSLYHLHRRRIEG